MNRREAIKALPLAAAIPAVAIGTEMVSVENQLSPSEALYGFAGWITSRPEVIQVGNTANCAVVADLVRDFCAANGLSDPRDDWAHCLTYPTQRGGSGQF